MKTYEDIMREHGWKQGLWNDNFAKKYVHETIKYKKTKNK